MLDSLADAIRRYTDAQPGEGWCATAIDGLVMLRSDHTKPPAHMVFKPALCLVAQGAKWTTFGDRRVDYRAGQGLVVSVETPALGCVIEASANEPFLGLALEFDLAVLREVLEGLDSPPRVDAEVGRGAVVIQFDALLADCALRLVRLLDTPRAIPMLYPAIMREICYWLLTGPQADEIAKLAQADSHARRVIAAVHTLRERFAEPVRIGELAAVAQMSASTFHRHFKALTAMTPLQYQKQLRLLEARRLLVAGEVNVETACFRVGYESPSQFSREYARMFGAPPRRDTAGVRALAA